MLAQSCQEYEIILVDDGSTDGSAEICDEYAEKQKTITVIHKENGGLSSATILLLVQLRIAKVKRGQRFQRFSTSMISGEKIEMDYAPRKIALPKERAVQNAFSVQKHHLDTNHHVNNCQYIRMAADHLPEDFKVGQLRVEYKRQAVLDNVIIPEVYMTENKEAVVLNAEINIMIWRR